MFKNNEVPHCPTQTLVLSEVRGWAEKGGSKRQIKLDEVFKTICKREYFSTIKIHQVKSNYSPSLKTSFISFKNILEL